MAKVTSAICDNRCHVFQNEILNKENEIRIKWFIKNQERLIANLGSEKLANRAREIAAKQDAERQRRISESKSVHQKHTCKLKLPSWRPRNHDDSINLDVMKPVEPEVRQILYEKGVESFITANNYFHERWKKFPENRYYFPDCTSWLYGWRLGDYPPNEASKVGLKAVMQAEFYQRTGSSLKRDPDWYRNCATKNAKDYKDPTSN